MTAGVETEESLDERSHHIREAILEALRASGIDLNEGRDVEPMLFDSEPHQETRVGVCFSGGGIRSAAFCLGAMQNMQSTGFWARTKYVSAVSGGGYVAAAEAITRTFSTPEALDDTPSWSRGSAEARYLRTNADYLAPGLFGRWWFFLNALWGATLNLAPIALASLVWGGTHAALLRRYQPGLAGQSEQNPTVYDGSVGSVNMMLWPIAVAAVLLGIAIYLIGIWRRVEARTTSDEVWNRQLRRTAERIQQVTGYLTAAAAVLLAAFIGLPVVVWLGRIASALGWSLLQWNSFPWSAPTTAEVPVGTDSFITTAVLFLLLLLTSALAVALARRSRAYRTMLALAGLSGPLLIMIPGLAMAHRVFAIEPSLNWEFGLIATAAGLCLLSAVFAHNGRYSMHMYYRERLAGVFMVRRNSQGGIENMHDRPIWFSEIETRENSPELIMCAALNVSDRVVPRGRQSAPFVFTTEKSGSPVFQRWFDTVEVEDSSGLGSPPLTLPSIVAISGAALSPVMGRLTIRPLRFLLAMLNVRLGVWIPNPSDQYRDRRDELQNRRLQHDMERVARLKQKDRVPKHREKRRYPDASLPRSFGRFIIDGWREPGALYVWREATGSMKLDRRFVYITDGGHWDNLGLFELIRRRCNRIICFDASLDPNDRFEGLRTAVALCRSDLGVDIDIDPRPLARDSDGVAVTDTVVGTIRYPDETSDGKLVYTRATICVDTPAVLQLRAQDHAFPDHSTGDQFFTDDEFEAFRALGYSASARSMGLIDLAGFRPPRVD